VEIIEPKGWYTTVVALVEFAYIFLPQSFPGTFNKLLFTGSLDPSGAWLMFSWVWQYRCGHVHHPYCGLINDVV
jgi:hypothetical protein